MHTGKLLVVLVSIVSLAAQTTGVQLKGTVTDVSSAAIPGAKVTIHGQGLERTAETDQAGAYSIAGLPAGKYSIRITASGFSPVEKSGVELQPGKQLSLDAQMSIAVGKQEITVSAEANRVSTEASNNAGAIVLHEADLEALSDDPDDLQADLQALAGPSAGPNGGQIFIDGFSNAKLPPKASIREVRINQNPFSAEYDRLGFGRIEILTKPGTDKIRGQAFFSDSNNALNARNPFSTDKPDFQSRFFGGNVSGPINKKASAFLDFERRQIDDSALVNATTLDTSLNPNRVNLSPLTLQRLTTISPRVDYQLTPKNTLVGRYTYSNNTRDGVGIGSFSLPSQGYATTMESHNMQLTETSMVSSRAVNETRLQFVRSRIDDLGDNTIPTINVLESFNGGGAQVGRSWNQQSLWEMQNYTTWTSGRHALKAGVRLRHSSQSDDSVRNFGGTFTFGGGEGPLLDANFQPLLDASGNPMTGQITSLERYRRTLYFQQMGLPPAQIRAMGGGATQFSIAGGAPLQVVRQTDVGAFAQDDWRVKPNLTVSLGLRYETQTNMHDWRDLAPRVGIAWAPGGRNGRQKTVIRGGFGMFYSRFDDNYTLQTLRYNGINQAQYIVVNPNFFPNVPPIGELSARMQPQTVWIKDGNLRAPYILQGAISVERQLPHSTTAALTFTESRADHLFRSNVLSAIAASSGTGNPGEQIYEYQSTGIMRQNQLIANINSRLSKNISLSSFYAFNHAKSDTDNAATFPANPSDLASEYGRASFDVRHRFMLMGSVSARHGIRFSPFVIMNSGAPFNITAGQDLYGNTLLTGRPAFAADPNAPGMIATKYGVFDPHPAAGETIIPRNYGEGPGSVSVNLRISKTFGLGAKRGGASSGADDMGGMRGGMRGIGGPGGGGRGGPGGGRMGGGGFGRGGFGGGETSDRRFSLTVSAMARNVLNHVNPGAPIGNLTSPLFGQSLSLGGGFGPGGSAANNRRLEFQLRLGF